MTTILAEAATVGAGNVQTIVTAVVATVVGLEAARWGKGRFKNGNGKSQSQPGYTPACVEHLQRLATAEAKIKSVCKTLDTLADRLDKLADRFDRMLESQRKGAG